MSLYRVYYRDRSWGTDAIEMFQIKYQDFIDSSESGAIDGFSDLDPDGFFSILGCEQLPQHSTNTFDPEHAYRLVAKGLTLEEPDAGPALPVEVWNKRKINSDEAMRAVRELSKGMGQC